MRTIDADNLHNAKFQNTSGYDMGSAYRCGWNEAIDAICENEPTIDAVSVVRCKECSKHNTHRCHMAFDLIATEDDDYCSYGEREGE